MVAVQDGLRGGEVLMGDTIFDRSGLDLRAHAGPNGVRCLQVTVGPARGWVDLEASEVQVLVNALRTWLAQPAAQVPDTGSERCECGPHRRPYVAPGATALQCLRCLKPLTVQA